MKRARPTPGCRFQAGLTLLEVLLVSTVISILLTLAVPAWREQSARAHRVIAAATLLRAAGCQQRLHAQQGRYDTDQCRPADSERYRFHYPQEFDAATGFTLVATPNEPQRGDACGWLSIDELGLQSVQNEDAAACWSGR